MRIESINFLTLQREGMGFSLLMLRLSNKYPVMPKLRMYFERGLFALFIRKDQGTIHLLFFIFIFKFPTMKKHEGMADDR